MEAVSNSSESKTKAVRTTLVQTVGETDQTLAESYLTEVAESNLLTGNSIQTHVPVGLVSPTILASVTDKLL